MVAGNGALRHGFAQLHREGNAFALQIHLQHPDFHNQAGLDHLARVFHKLTSTSGISCEAKTLAESTDAPASLTTTFSGSLRPWPAGLAMPAGAAA